MYFLLLFLYYVNAARDTRLDDAKSNFAATSVGSLALFGGGIRKVFFDAIPTVTDSVDVFDIVKRKHTAELKLSLPRADLTATSVGDKAFFAG
jgi:hypothetical protein